MVEMTRFAALALLVGCGFNRNPDIEIRVVNIQAAMEHSRLSEGQVTDRIKDKLWKENYGKELEAIQIQKYMLVVHGTSRAQLRVREIVAELGP